jgi:hypothetical protein
MITLVAAVFVAALCSARLEDIFMDKGKLAGPELKAFAVALERFRMEEVKSDLANFMVIVTDNPSAFEIVFVPLPYREVHYKISKQTYVHPWHATPRQSTIQRRRVLVSALSFAFPRPAGVSQVSNGVGHQPIGS